jgi:hypothetical protein
VSSEQDGKVTGWRVCRFNKNTGMNSIPIENYKGVSGYLMMIEVTQIFAECFCCLYPFKITLNVLPAGRQFASFSFHCFLLVRLTAGIQLLPFVLMQVIILTVPPVTVGVSS